MALLDLKFNIKNNKHINFYKKNLKNVNKLVSIFPKIPDLALSPVGEKEK
jgi:hypothetical protein